MPVLRAAHRLEAPHLPVPSVDAGGRHTVRPATVLVLAVSGRSCLPPLIPLPAAGMAATCSGPRSTTREISRSSGSTRFSRRSCASSSRSAAVRPSVRRPSSRSACLSRVRSVSSDPDGSRTRPGLGPAAGAFARPRAPAARLPCRTPAHMVIDASAQELLPWGPVSPAPRCSRKRGNSTIPRGCGCSRSASASEHCRIRSDSRSPPVTQLVTRVSRSGAISPSASVLDE